MTELKEAAFEEKQENLSRQELSQNFLDDCKGKPSCFNSEFGRSENQSHNLPFLELSNSSSVIHANDSQVGLGQTQVLDRMETSFKQEKGGFNSLKDFLQDTTDENALKAADLLFEGDSENPDQEKFKELADMLLRYKDLGLITDLLKEINKNLHESGYQIMVIPKPCSSQQSYGVFLRDSNTSPAGFKRLFEFNPADGRARARKA